MPINSHPRRAICGALFILATSLSTLSAPAQAQAASDARLQLVDLPREQAVLVTEAVRLFDTAGLVLPTLVVRGSTDSTACDGHHGLHRVQRHSSIITLCLGKLGPWSRHIVLHELAHAWSAFSLSADRQAAFQQLRGWAEWRDYEHYEWSANGTEQAAEIIAWGLNDQIAPALQIEDDSCAELRRGFVALTGIEPLHGLTQLCTSTPRTMS